VFIMNQSQSISTTHACAADVDSLNSLLRGEIAAVDTYEQALRKFADAENAPIVTALTRIRNEHSESVGLLRSRVSVSEGKPSEDAGPWGLFAGTVTAGAKMIGPVTALAALKQGEMHGIDQYEKTLNNKEVSTECNYLISSDLLPRCRKHVTSLETLIAQCESKA